MSTSIITSIRVYAVVIAIACETIRSSYVWESPSTRIGWLLQYHWALTTPLMLASLVPSIPVAAIFGIVSAVLTITSGILVLLFTTVAFRCGTACVSTLPFDLIRIAILAIVTLYSFLCTIAWWRLEQRPPLHPRRHLALLILVGALPTSILLFSSWGILAAPALAIDPPVFWLVQLERRSIAFTGVLLLCAFDILHLFLFKDTPYFQNLLLFRTFIDIGRAYIRLATI